MAVFFYRAMDPAGEIQIGNVEAASLGDAAEELRRKGLLPLDVAEGRKTLSMRLNEPVTLFSKPTPRDVQGFLRDLARLLRAGLPIDSAFKLLIDMQEKLSLKTVLEDMLDKVRRGESLAQAMSEHKELFTIQITASVQAGEQSGTLPDALDALSEGMDRSLGFMEKLRSALIYPSILMMMVVGTFVLVMTFVLPQFAPLFNGNEDKLPWMTGVVMNLSAVFREYWPIFFAVFSGGVFLLVWTVVSKKRRGKLLSTLAGLPFLRQWLTIPELVRFVRTLGVCLKSGIVLDKAIVMAMETVNMPHMREGLINVRALVRRGEILSNAFITLGWMPPVVLQFTRVGEQSGNLGVMLEEAASILTQDFEAKLEKTLEVISPILTLVMGGIVALLVGSVLLGIMSINDVV